MNFRILFFILMMSQASFAQREVISLAGKWHTPLGAVQLPGTMDESRLAPPNRDTTSTGQLTRRYPFAGKIKYTREINIPPGAAHQQWRLVLERSKPGTVWVDNDSIGYSPLILSPQVYPLGKLKAGKHTLTILVDNTDNAVPKGIQGSHAWTDATQTNWNGIIGNIQLEAFDGLLIDNVQLYPDAKINTIPVAIKIFSEENTIADIVINGHTWNTSRKLQLPSQKKSLYLEKGEKVYHFDIQTGDEKALWSEFDPALYRIQFELNTSKASDSYHTDIGIRDFAASGTQFTINQLKTFLRGKHDACVFPLTGYPPMDKKVWKEQFLVAKSYGINHYRFHSWTPPQAAFEAANEVGIYLQPELPFWGVMDKDSNALNSFLLQHGIAILNAYGNNPSFVMMALGNELGGDQRFMKTFTDHFKRLDSRHLYAFGSNNWLGTGGQQQGEDFFVTCRVGGEVGTLDYSTHTRASFSFADAKQGGILNGTYPSSSYNFSKAVAACTVPLISHENGQFQVYPDYKEIKKYTGVLYPYNLEIFRSRLQQNNLQHQALAFHQATTAFALACYKADIEMCLRTPGFGGYQLLDLQDYPGQGSAYVGLLDAFMKPKAGISPRSFTGFNGAVVPLAVMPKYCWYSNEDFTSKIQLFNYGPGPIDNKILHWKLSSKKNNKLLASGNMTVHISQGTLADIGNIQTPLKKITKPSGIIVQLRIDKQVNEYTIWVYPVKKTQLQAAVLQTTSLDTALQALSKGTTVLLIPDHTTIAQQSVAGMFTPDYWNYAMFKNISESLKREVSPGTLSILTDPTHALFDYFPTDQHTNWQWWTLLKNSRPLILDNTPAGYSPLVQVIDNIERNYKLGLVFEMKIGKGKLLVSMCDITKITDKPEGVAFKNALYEYLQSPAFNPPHSFTPESMKTIFREKNTDKNIKGVKNITSYE